MPSRKKILQSVLLIISLGVATYLLGLNNEFRIDDESFFDPGIRNKFTSLGAFFGLNPIPEEQHYNPINFLLNIPLFGMLPHNPIGFRLINLTLFLGHGVLIYYFLVLLTKNNTLSLLASSFFVVHPLNTETAGQIFLNIVLLAAIFMQLCLIYYWQFLENPSLKKYRTYSLFFFTAALLSFETGFLLPFYLLTLIVFFRKSSFRETIKSILPFIAILVLFFSIWSSFAGHRSHIIEKLISFHATLPSFTASITSLLAWYLRNILLGDRIAFMYSMFPLKAHLLFWNIASLVAAIGIITITCCRWKINFRSFSLCYFLIGLLLFLPASVGHAEMGFVIEPHWLYFASAGSAFLLAEALLSLRNLIRPQVWSFVVVALLSFFFLQTQTTLAAGRTAKEYYAHWLEVSPNNYLAYLSLCNLYSQEKDYVQVLYYSQQAVKATTGRSYNSEYNIGSIWGEFNRLDLAENSLQKAIAIDPRAPVAYYRLGQLYLKNNRSDKAVEYFHLALTADPSFTPAQTAIDKIISSQKK